MKQLITLLMIFFAVSLTAQTKTKNILIYDDYLTHNKITAVKIFDIDGELLSEKLFYTVTYAKMWTGIRKTIIVNKDSYDGILNFFSELKIFASEDLGATTEIDGIEIKIVKKIGAIMLEIATDDIPVYTHIKEIERVIEQLNKYKQ